MKRSKKKVILPEIDPLIPEGYPIASPGSTGASTHATRRILVIGPSGKTKGVRAGELGLMENQASQQMLHTGVYLEPPTNTVLKHHEPAPTEGIKAKEKL